MQLLPIDIISFAEGNPHDVYKYVIPVKAVNQKTFKQITMTKWEKYIRPQNGSAALNDIDYVSASIGSGFELLTDHNGNLTQSTNDRYKVRIC